MKIKLTVVSGDQAGREYTFSNYETFTVGRSRDATFCIQGDRAFSRLHFLIEINPPLCSLRNLSQTGGTYVNGKPVTEAVLKNGDIISGGKETKIRVEIESPEKAANPGAPEVTALLTESDSVPADERSGELQQFSGYDTLRTLGQGGMGTVFLARRRSDGATVAIKTMIPRKATSSKAIAFFLREIDVLSKLRHPHIVELISAGKTNGPAGEQLYFVMEFVPGQDMEALTKETAGKIGLGRAVKLFEQVLEGLSFAHEQGFVHRDIKGHNILIAEQAGRETAKIGDFGLARSFEQAGLSGLTRTGDTRGTLNFMAPEQLLNARLADPRSDLYSVAATMYRLLTGHHLWNPKPDLRDPLLLILHEDPVPIRQRRPDIPQGLAWVIHKALSRDPKHRFADAEMMRQAMRMEF
jgi:serine/threonine-protein kinase